jgi:hypothetical protein
MRVIALDEKRASPHRRRVYKLCIALGDNADRNKL